MTRWPWQCSPSRCRGRRTTRTCWSGWRQGFGPTRAGHGSRRPGSSRDERRDEVGGGAREAGARRAVPCGDGGAGRALCGVAGGNDGGGRALHDAGASMAGVEQPGDPARGALVSAELHVDHPAVALGGGADRLPVDAASVPGARMGGFVAGHSDRAAAARDRAEPSDPVPMGAVAGAGAGVPGDLRRALRRAGPVHGGRRVRGPDDEGDVRVDGPKAGTGGVDLGMLARGSVLACRVALGKARDRDGGDDGMGACAGGVRADPCVLGCDEDADGGVAHDGVP